MLQQYIKNYFLIALIIGTTILTIFIFQPFIYAIILAVIVAVVVYPLHKRIFTIFSGRKAISAFCTLSLVIIFLLIPLTFLTVKIFQETHQLYRSMSDTESRGVLIQNANQAIESIRNYIPTTDSTPIDVETYAKQGLKWIIGNFGNLFNSITSLITSFFIFIIALYYFLKEGHVLKNDIIALSPLSDVDDALIIRRLIKSINSVVRGNLVLAIVQGTLGAIGLAIFGVPNPILWGTFTAIAALIPGVGTSLVMVPATIYLYISGHTPQAIGLLVWAFAGVGLVDNFLGPHLVGQGSNIHPLIVLLSVLGGIAFFGPIGFLLGPLTINVLWVLIDVYSSKRKVQSQ